MSWENFEERFTRPLTVRISLPAGSVWLPDTHLTIDEWLTSMAETDEELVELNIRRIRFLQNHWPIEKLLELEWDKPFDRHAVFAMYAGHKAYILSSDGFEYELIAAIAPTDQPAVYRTVIGRLLKDPHFVPAPPTFVKTPRPDLLPDLDDVALPDQGARRTRPDKGYMSKLLVGWVGGWINVPVFGYWHDDNTSS